MLLTPSPECPPRPNRQNNSHAAPQLKSTRGQCLKISPNPIKKEKNVCFLVVSDKFEKCKYVFLTMHSHNGIANMWIFVHVSVLLKI